MTTSSPTQIPSSDLQGTSCDAVPAPSFSAEPVGDRDAPRPQAERASRKVVAAISDDATASTVLSVADAIGKLYTASVAAVHVGQEHAALTAVARTFGLPLTTVAGQPVKALVRAAAAEDVVVVVIAARGAPAGKRPIGSTAAALVTSLEKPVVVVPPDAPLAHAVDSVLVPLDGTAVSAAALREVVALASDAEIEIVAAHVHEERSLPAFSDQLPHEVRAWSEEFLARYCPSATEVTLELRVGEPHERLLDILRRSHCDLVALGWSQDLARGRAAVVRRMLAESPVPVLLTPVSSDCAFAPVAAAPALDTINRERA
jgi:nucleotide-binding universal stress UspA family protein